MKLPRRQFLHLVAGAATLPAMSRTARAQAYPTRPVRIILGFAAGGGLDTTARLIGQSLSERLDQRFIIENRTGANGKIATEAVVRSAPDGYTLLMIGGPTYDKPSRDIAPVAGIINQPYVMLVNPSFPTKTIPAFIAYAKAYPGQINMGSAGIGGPNHLLGELFKTMTGVNMLHVPYRGGAPPQGSGPRRRMGSRWLAYANPKQCRQANSSPAAHSKATSAHDQKWAKTGGFRDPGFAISLLLYGYLCRSGPPAISFLIAFQVTEDGSRSTPSELNYRMQWDHPRPCRPMCCNQRFRGYVS